MDKLPSRKKFTCQKQDKVTGDDGNASPPASRHVGTGPISGSSAVPGGASSSDGERSIKPLCTRGKEPALAGGSSTATVGSPPPPSKSLEGGETKAEGSKQKRKKAVLNDPDVPCSKCPRLFSSLKALHGHMGVHKDHGGDKQAEVAARTLLNLGQTTLNKIKVSEAEGDSSAVPEGGTSSLAEEAQRKNIHMRFDLNKDAPVDDDEHCGGHNGAAQVEYVKVQS